MSAIRISAIICTLNRAGYLEKAIQSLVDQTLPKEQYEIIVVDNGSTDNTKTIVEGFKQLKNLRYIYEPVTGLSQARNTGWQSAQGEYVAFIDDDAIAGSEWLQRIVEVFDTVHPQPASIGGKVIPIWEIERPTWLTKGLEKLLTILDWADKPRFLDEGYQFLVGTNVAYQRGILQRFGGFNTNLGRKGTNLLGNEESLLKRRLQEHNMRVYCHPEICVQHHIQAERLVKPWFYRTFFWHGISVEIQEYIESGQNGGNWHYLYRAMASALRFVRSPRRMLLILMPTNSPNRMEEKCRLYRRLGRIWAQLKIGLGMVKRS